MAFRLRTTRELTRAEIRKIAERLRDERAERTFIVYYLPGMDVDAGAWASSHFNPDLEIRIYGREK